METLNQKDEGYRGIWYMNQPSGDEYVFKYSGGLGTYCAKHQPFAVYSPRAEKTFFCWGGTVKNDYQRLHHMVSYYDHAKRMVPRPTVLLNKETDDAHDNPVISLDSMGYIWVFSSSHGTSRPSYIHRSTSPYNIEEFELVPATRFILASREPFDNFSYMQVWHVSERGFAAFLTHYNDPAIRTIFFISSPDGVSWTEWQRLAAIEQGHYQISAVHKEKIASVFNFHPADKQPGLNWRTNLYYVESSDFGGTWHSVGGQLLACPLTEVDNTALVYDYQKDGLKVYLKDILFDCIGYPVILYVTSKGYESGPGNGPRTWTTARWNGRSWDIRPAMKSDSNYDMGSLYLEGKGNWRLIAPTETGPQPFNPGGEVAMWLTKDFGLTWNRIRKVTAGSKYNHTYVRRPVNAHPDFYALWADGHARKMSPSRIYFCTREGDAYILPEKMEDDLVQPLRVSSTDKLRG